MRRLLVLAAALLAAIATARDTTITILHTNDLHARVEGTKLGQGTYGGYSRHATLIRRFMASDPNPLLVNAGDTFQGTIYFNVYEGLADLKYLNTMGYRGAAVGNHEFDRGPAVFANYIKNAQFPELACNLDVSQEPALRDLIKPWTIVQVGKERIGLIGATPIELPTISSIGPNVKMIDLDKALTESVAALTRQGINKIVLLSHLGYDIEKRVAHDIAGIDVIVGGHSHSLLGTFDNPDFPKSEGPYPTVIKNMGGSDTLIVSSWEWGKVFGRIKVTFDDKGRVKKRADAQPIPVDSSIPEDPLVRAHMAALAKPIASVRGRIVGQTATPLNGSREDVRKREATMANVVADALWEAGRHEGADLGLVSGGSIRASIDAGPVTYEEALAVQPFGNSFAVIGLTGDELRRSLEYGVATWEQGVGQFLHVSGNVKYTFDLAKPAGQRVVSVTIDGQPVDPEKLYKVAMNSFMASGGDNAAIFANASHGRINEPAFDVDILIAYLETHRNLSVANEGRITILNEPRR